MLNIMKNKKAQAIMGEYVLLIFLAMAVAMSMMIYFKRAVQTRIHNARDYMVGEVRERTRGVYNGDLYKEYEPYYGNTIATVSRDDYDETRLEPAASSGIFRKIYDKLSTVRVNSETAPPKEFERTTPKN